MDYKKSAALSAAIILLFFSCNHITSSQYEFALGTVCSVSLFEYGNNTIYNNIFFKIREIENQMSVHIPFSDISRINAAAGIEPVTVNEDVFKVIERAKYFAEVSGGAFDPTVGPIVSLWGIGSENQRVPSQKEIEETLPLVNWRYLELDAETNSVFLKYPNMALDLGAIAKGYAADEASNIAKSAGVKRASIDLGGNVIIYGIKKDKSPWRVGIQNPGKDRGIILGIINVQDKTVVTSGIYERYFTENEIHYHHIFDPSNGYPAQNSLISVTVITDISMDADALSTAIFVLGFEKGSELLKDFPQAQAVFIFKDNSIITTPGVNFTITDKTYFLKN
ncbi:MAG: FAD:protein FMN transferase [Treponema sp.]|nr:FAD:protein FMN transferase [Treponema sp.]